MIRSLDPQNVLEAAIAQQIANSLWKGTRLEMCSAFKQEEVLGKFTAARMAGYLGVESKRQESLMPVIDCADPPKTCVSSKSSIEFTQALPKGAYEPPGT